MNTPDPDAKRRLEEQWYRLRCLEPEAEEVAMLVRFLTTWREDNRKRRLPFE